jgi:hypothetical protein
MSLSQLVRCIALFSLAACATSTPAPAPPEAKATRVQETPEPPPPPYEPPPRDARCPAEAPTAGSGCSASLLRCAYGEHPGCASLWECYLGTWHERARAPCDDASRRSCPAQPGPSPKGVPVESNLLCVYPTGVACAFGTDFYRPCSGVPQPPPPPQPPYWRCRAPGPIACAGSQEEGTPCEPDGVFCGPDCCGTGARCDNGTWRTVGVPCPP